MLYEIRTYTFKPLRAAEWLALYKSEALPLQKEFLGELVGFFTTEIGDISQIVHIWAYKSLDDRLDVEPHDKQRTGLHALERSGKIIEKRSRHGSPSLWLIDWL